jgi:hypothetical protein
VGLDLMPAARRTLGRRFMGLGPAVGGDAGGRLPRLARGLALEDRRD